MNASIDTWSVEMQVMNYRYDAADAADPNSIAVASYNWAYLIASKANVYSFNVAKKFDTDWGSLTFYNDFGMLTPKTDDHKFDDSYMNVTGCLIATGPIYTYIDFIRGKNMYAASKNDHVGLQAIDNDWENRININFGYYF
jgi:hypothetical protein